MASRVSFLPRSRPGYSQCHKQFAEMERAAGFHGLACMGWDNQLSLAKHDLGILGLSGMAETPCAIHLA
eukprot:11168710-Alexandrium_andersonii.AAC.1